MKIAVIGSGISGLTTAYLLSRKHEVHVFEANASIGGHTATVDVRVKSGEYAIDTGFIVFNDWTYPNFIKLIDQLGVASQTTEMSFSVKVEKNGLEYNGTSINTLFAQRSNFFRPSFHRMIRDLLRFNQESLSVLNSSADGSAEKSGHTLGEYLAENGYSSEFKNHYIVPMGAAIWSASAKQMDDFPIQYFVQFFKNHGMLSVSNRPQWRVIKGGSRSYLGPLTKSFQERIHLSTRVLGVRRAAQVEVMVEHAGAVEKILFDQVVFASHSNQTLALLSDPTAAEREVLSGFAYQPNVTILHTDERVLPKKKLAWAAWNYLVPRETKNQVAVTYDMNILQQLNAPETFCVSLNLEAQIDPKKILRRFVYDHPVYTQAALQSQARWAEVSGQNQTHFCGAYWGFGFHEDGVNSALRVCEKFGEAL
jgi:predicted NAD/FAD-binding protein